MSSPASKLALSDVPVPDVWSWLHEKSFERPWAEKVLSDLAAMPGCIGLTALIGDEPAGFVLARQTLDEAEVLTICVLPDARRQAIGAQLMTGLMNRLKNAHTLFLEVDALNEPAIRLYTSIGFSQVGERKAYYQHADGSKTDALLLRKELDG